MSEANKKYSERRDFTRGTLSVDDIHACGGSPWAFFSTWMDQAQLAGLEDYNATVLSSLSLDGWPDGRVVLVRSIDAFQDTDGQEHKTLSLFTNFNSEKGRQLAADSRCSLTFYWKELERQVRMLGRAFPLSDAECDAYFASRPRESQLSAWASHQSEVIDDRATLDKRMAEAARRFEGITVERPPHWGGYAFAPHVFEFWQGRANRLHDRIRCTKESGEWSLDRLSP